MLRLITIVSTISAAAFVFAQGERPVPGGVEPGEAALEGIVRCTSSQTKVVYVETEVAGRSEPPAQRAVMDQRGLEFIPHILPVRVGTRVAFVNSDPVRHSVFSPSPTTAFNLGTYPSGVTRYVTFDRPGVVRILCNVHPEMEAYVVVLETPFFTLTDEQGRYRIEHLPPGQHAASLWCEDHGTFREKIRIGTGLTHLDFDGVGRAPRTIRSLSRHPAGSKGAGGSSAWAEVESRNHKYGQKHCERSQSKDDQKNPSSNRAHCGELDASCGLDQGQGSRQRDG